MAWGAVARLLEDAQSQVARPEGLGRIVAVLAYLAAVCIVGPLALMAWGRTAGWGRIALLAWSRGLVVASFISGLIAFLLVLVYLLRDHPGVTSLVGRQAVPALKACRTALARP